jgi:hypothetical protein
MRLEFAGPLASRSAEWRQLRVSREKITTKEIVAARVCGGTLSRSGLAASLSLPYCKNKKEKRS